MTLLDRAPAPAARLKAILTRDGASPAARRHALDALRQSLEAARAQAQKHLAQKPLAGLAAAAGLCRSHDRIITGLFQAACEIFPRADSAPAPDLALAATGGYGRGLLAPASDIDLLFLVAGPPAPRSEKIIEYMLYMLWDLGLKTGHAVRRPELCIQQARADMTVCTSLLDARFLCGAPALYADFARRFARRIRARRARAFVAAKLAERDRRHLAAGQSRYLVEPNVKDGKGGLRDLQSMIWIAKYCYAVETGGDLARAGLFTETEQRRFRRCETLLWAVRCHLHFLTGRAEERLSFDVQKEIAARAGFHARRPGLDAVERFMKKYFLTAKYVGDLTRLFCAQLEEQHKKPLLRLPAMLRRRSKAVLPPGFVLERRRLALRPGAEQRLAARPLMLLQLFHAAAIHDLDIHPASLRQAARARGLSGRALRADPQANRLFVEILTAPAAAERVLRLMNEAGILGRFIPDFGRIVALMQFNMYHHYTADEHLLRAVGQLARIEQGRLRAEAPLASGLMAGLAGTPARAVLYLAVFLHDIAKGRGGDHSRIGAQVARRLGPRLGFDPGQTRLAAWLVENHLILSDTAQRRDIADPRTVLDFARQVETPERLALLLILTVADIRAVGPGVWNGWKGQLLRTLYVQTLARLTGRAPESAQEAQAARRRLAPALARWPAHSRAGYFAFLPDAYWSGLEPDVHLRHARLYRRFARPGRPGAGRAFVFAAHDDVGRAASEILILADDHPGLFARLAGAFAVAGLRVADAKIFTARTGAAFDAFWVQDENGRALCDPRRIERLRRMILDVLAGRLIPGRILAARPAPPGRLEAFSVAPRIVIDNQASADCSVIEVSCLDRPGLLYGLARALFHLGLVTVSAHIATFGERAADVFYVKDGTGQKIRPSRHAALKRRLGAAAADPLARERRPAA